MDRENGRQCGGISIHAPAKGATSASPVGYHPESYFNPRSREGSDTGPRNISRPMSTFQSTLPRRERRLLSRYGSDWARFQSTLPRRERRMQQRGSKYDQNFNPRSREGSDTERETAEHWKEISIHAPAKGATRPRRCARRDMFHFNPRSREGSDGGRPLEGRPRHHFNPRSREGSDACSRHYSREV